LADPQRSHLQAEPAVRRLRRGGRGL